MSENRVDPTVAGLYLVGFVTLFFGLLGILTFLGSADATFAGDAAVELLFPVGAVMIVLAYMAGKAGNAFATALFAFIGVAFLAINAGAFVGSSIGAYAAAIFFIIFAIVAFIIGAPKLLAILLLLVALFFLFFGFAGAATSVDAAEVYAAAYGLFSFVAFIVATYLAVALGTQKMPVF